VGPAATGDYMKVSGD